MGERLDGLDALRGVAAICVVFFHFGPTKQFIMAGDLAVDLFFVISGFVMARTYEQRMDRMSAARFFVIRFRRLWPIFAICTLFGAGYFIAAGAALDRVLVSTAAVLLFMPSPLPLGRHRFNPNGPGWSLLFELLANIIHAVALKRLTLRQLAVIWLICFGALAFSTIRDGFIPSGGHIGLMPWALARTLVGYIAGIIVFRTGLRVVLRPSLVLVSVPALLMAGGFLPKPAFGLSFIIAAPFMVAALTGKIQIPFANQAGAISYPLYAVHVPAFNWFGPFGILAAFALAAILVAVDRLARRLIAARSDRTLVDNDRLSAPAALGIGQNR